MNNIFKENSLNPKVTTDLLNSENLKIAKALLKVCNELQVCNFTVLVDPKVHEPEISYCCSAMPGATHLQFYYVIADPKVDE